MTKFIGFACSVFSITKRLFLREALNPTSRRNTSVHMDVEHAGNYVTRGKESRRQACARCQSCTHTAVRNIFTSAEGVTVAVSVYCDKKVCFVFVTVKFNLI